MNKINYFKAWAIFFLITTLGSIAAGYLVGIVLLTLGFEAETQAGIFKVFGFAAGIVVSFLGFKFSVKTFIVEANEHRTLNIEYSNCCVQI